MLSPCLRSGTRFAFLTRTLLAGRIMASIFALALAKGPWFSRKGFCMHRLLFAVWLFLIGPLALAQDGAGNVLTSSATSQSQEISELRAELARLSARLDVLEHNASAPSPAAAAAAANGAPTIAAVAPAAPSTVAVASGTASPSVSAPGKTAPPLATQGTAQATVPAQSSTTSAASPLAAVLPANLPGGATLNYTFDGYYEYNFNDPPGRVNNLRAYDVLSNTFSINQADMIFALDPNVEQGRRYGVRLDLQFGQATETLQGNSANEPRPEIYRNIFQAYGTYVFPVGKGLNVDFGKWASSIGIEGNYT